MEPVAGLPFFHATVPEVVAGDRLAVTGPEAHHAVVRRLRPGEPVVVTDGAGRLVRAEVVSSTKAELVLAVGETRVVPRAEPTLTVVQAIPKGERADRTVEVLTEVGVDRLVPWAAARCVATWRGDRLEKSLARWRATARESAKQSRRAWLPEVTPPVDTPTVARLLADADLGVVLHEAAGAHLAGLDVPATGSVVVVVGPEGGLTDTEVETLGASGHVVRLGETVLRTSTAGVVAAAALLSRTPRWR